MRIPVWLWFGWLACGFSAPFFASANAHAQPLLAQGRVPEAIAPGTAPTVEARPPVHRVDVQTTTGPSLELPTDSSSPVPTFAVTSDLGAALAGEYALSIEVAPWPLLSVCAGGGWGRVDGAPGLLLELGVRTWPTASGLEGPFAGPRVGHLRAWGGSEIETRVQLEAGYQWVWGGLALAPSFAMGRRWRSGSQEATSPFLISASLRLGYVWV